MARQAGQQDNDLCELYFWGSTAEFYDSKLIDACAEAAASGGSEEAASKWLSDFEDAGYAIVPTGVDSRPRIQRIECSQVIIRCQPFLVPAGVRGLLDSQPQALGRLCHRRAICR